MGRFLGKGLDIDLYAIRGSIHDIDTLAIVEHAVTSAIILITATVCLFLLYRRDDHASLVVAPVPAVGVFLGCLSARKKRQKEVAELHREGEIRR